MALRITIIEGPEVRRVTAAMAAEDKTMQPRLNDAMQDAVEPYVSRARAKVLAMPVKGTGHTGLRARVARGVRMVATGPVVKVISTMTFRNQLSIPPGLNFDGWRHPVFGNRNVWVNQGTTVPGWFTETLAGSRDDIENSLEDVIESSADRIAAAG